MANNNGETDFVSQAPVLDDDIYDFLNDGLNYDMPAEVDLDLDGVFAPMSQQFEIPYDWNFLPQTFETTAEGAGETTMPPLPDVQDTSALEHVDELHTTANNPPRSTVTPSEEISVLDACAVIRKYLRSIKRDESIIISIEWIWYQSNVLKQPIDGFVQTKIEQQSLAPSLHAVASTTQNSINTESSQNATGLQAERRNINQQGPSVNHAGMVASDTMSTFGHRQPTEQTVINGISIVAPPIIKSSHYRQDHTKSPMIRAKSKLDKGPPQEDSTLPHWRPNARSKGHNVRSAAAQMAVETARFNYGSESFPPPLSQGWQPKDGPPFSYDKFGELTEKTLSTKRLRQFIFEHPIVRDPQIPLGPNDQDKGKMILWLQIVPSDVGGRYHTSTRHKCRFQDCPLPRNTLGAGHLQVVFDEKWSVYGDVTDPFCYATAVHLYCLERYLNLPRICQLSNVVVRVDNRQLPYEYLRENRMQPFDSTQHIMSKFITACKNSSSARETRDALNATNYFQGYPFTTVDKSSPDYSAVYHTTLNYHCQFDWTDRKRDGHARQVFQSHMGDLVKFQALQKRSSAQASRKNDHIGERRSPRNHPGSPRLPQPVAGDINNQGAEIDSEAVFEPVSGGIVGLGIRRSPRLAQHATGVLQPEEASTRRDSFESLLAQYGLGALQSSKSNEGRPSKSPIAQSSSSPKSILKSPGTPRSRAATGVSFADQELDFSTAVSNTTQTDVVSYDPNSLAGVPRMQSPPNSKKRSASPLMSDRDVRQRLG